MAVEVLLSMTLIAAGSFVMLIRFHLLSVQHLNVIQVMFVSHVFGQIFPAMIFFVDSDFSAAQTFLLYNSAAALLIPVGGVMADMLLPIKNTSAFYRKPLANSLADRKIFLFSFIAYFGFCTLIFVAYVVKSPTIPVMDLLFKVVDADAHGLSRREATSQGLIYGMARQFFMPVLFMLSVIGLTYLKTLSARPLLFSAASMALIYNAWPGSKSPVAMLFLLIFIIVILRRHEQPPGVKPPAGITKRRRRNRWLGIAMLAMLIGYPLLIYMFTPIRTLGLQFIITQIFARIFYKPALNSYYAFEMFADSSYTYFADVKKWANLIGQDYIPLSTEISVYKGVDAFSNSPPAAIGNFYAQGGPVVVVAGVIMAAFIFRFAENLFRLSAIKTPLTLTCFGFLIYGAFRFSWANFHTLIMSELFIPMILLLGLFSFFQLSRQTNTGKTSKCMRYGGMRRSQTSKLENING